MALFEFGAAKRRKACLERIGSALELARRELEEIRYHQSIVMRLIGAYDRDGEDHEWQTNAFARANGYLEIASENVKVGLNRAPFPPFKGLVPPLDPRDRKIQSFFQSFRRLHYGPAPNPACARDGPLEAVATADPVFVLNGERELLGLMPSRPVGAQLDDYEGYVFIAVAGPLDADEREWLTHAIWGAGINLPADHVPNDATLLSHARMASAGLVSGRVSEGRWIGRTANARSVHAAPATSGADAAESSSR